MTHDEIKKLDERELYEKLVEFAVDYDTPTPKEIVAWCWKDVTQFLGFCYRAEEKLFALGLKKEWGNIISGIVLGDADDVIHAHPIQRAQAILMTTAKIPREGNDGKGNKTTTTNGI